MKDDAITTYLEEIKKNTSFDADFVELMITALKQDEEGDKIAQKIIATINSRHVKNQENTA
jgi:hypothetical protein